MVPLDSIEFVEHEFSTHPLHHSKVDALSAYLTDEPFEIRSSGSEPVVFSPRSAGIDFYGDGLYTTEAYIEDHPKIVASFRKASLLGWEYAIKNPNEVIGWILEKYTDRKSRKALEYEAYKTIDLIANDIVEVGYMNPGRWEHMADVFRSAGMIEGEVDIKGMLYETKAPIRRSVLLKVIAATALCFAPISIIALKQRQDRIQLKSEIERRKASEQLLSKREKEYSSIFKEAPLAFIVFDSSLRIKAWNQAAESIFGWSEQETLGKIATDFMAPKSAFETIHEAKAALKKNKSRTLINENLTKDGRTILCRWHNVSRKNLDGEVVEFHSIAVDVTSEIAEKEQLNEHYSAIHSSNKKKDKLIAQTSHEIRNPLNAIMGYAQILQSDAPDAQTEEMAQIIMEGAESMVALLNDLLDSSKIDAGMMELNFTEFDLAQLIQKNHDLYKQLIGRKGLEFKLTVPEGPCLATSDESRLGQIITNLLSNAAKFTRTGHIEIKLEVISDTDRSSAYSYAIEVIDTGIGMDQTTLQMVFEPFTQANKHISLEYGGTGLGLTLSKKLAGLLSGELTAQSEPGNGSCFTLYLPKRPK
jgi:PAS domain S-box-containing protein